MSGPSQQELDTPTTIEQLSPQEQTKKPISVKAKEILGKIISRFKKQTPIPDQILQDIISIPEPVTKEEEKEAKSIDVSAEELQTEGQLSESEDSTAELSEHNQNHQKEIAESPSDKLIRAILQVEDKSPEQDQLFEQLLENKDPEALPFIALFQFRRSGYLSGGHVSKADVDFVEFIKSLTPDQLGQVQRLNAPGLTQVIETLRNKSDFFLSGLDRYSEEGQKVQEQIEQGLVQIGTGYLASGNESYQKFAIDLFGRVHIDLGQGYSNLPRVLQESQNPALQQAILKFVENRALTVRDEKAVTILAQSYAKLDPEMQAQVAEKVPKLFMDLAGKTGFDPACIAMFSEVLNRPPWEVDQTLKFLGEIEDIDPLIPRSPNLINGYFELARNQEALLPFIKEIQKHGYQLEYTSPQELPAMLNNREFIVSSLQRIRQTFPDFRYIPIKQTAEGQESIIDPYQVLIRRMSARIEPNEAIYLLRNLNQIPEEYRPQAQGLLFQSALTEIKQDEIDNIHRGREKSLLTKLEYNDQDLVVNFLIDHLNARDFGEKESEYYGHIMAMLAKHYSAQDRLYRFERTQVGSEEIEIKTPQLDRKHIDEVIQSGEQRQAFAYLYHLADTYRYNLEEEVYTQSIEAARDERGYIYKLYEGINDPRLKQLAALRTYEYLVDPDLGDPESAQSFLDQIGDPSLKTVLNQAHERELERIQAGRKKYHEVVERVNESSPANVQALIEEFGFDEEDKKVQLEQEIQRVQETRGVTINMTFQTILRVLSESRRFKTTWETRSRSGSEGYDGKRDQIERTMGIRAKGTRGDPHPLYGALSSLNGRDERTGGAGAGYGDSWIVLKSDRVKNRTTFTYGDSFDGHTEQVLSWEDGVAAKAILNLQRGEGYRNPGPGYVEAQILGGLSTDDIESVNVPLTYLTKGAFFGGEKQQSRNEEEVQRIRANIDQLRQRFPNVKFNIIE